MKNHSEFENFDDYKVIIGRCKIIDGPFFGDAFIYFDNAGICFHFLNAGKIMRAKNIASHKFTRTREEVIKPGSSFAKFLMFFIAFNGQNDARQIAATYAMGHFATDRRGYQFIYNLLISAGKNSFTTEVTTAQARMIGLALNSPRKFYQLSVSKHSFHKPVLFFQPSTKHWLLYWFFGWAFFLSNTENKNMHEFLSVFLLVFLFGPILFKFFHKIIVKRRTKNFINSEKYIETLETFN